MNFDPDRFRIPPDELERREKLAAERKIETATSKRVSLSRASRFVPPMAFPLVAHLARVCPTPEMMGLYLAVTMEMRRLKSPMVRVQTNQLGALGLVSKASRSRAVSTLETLGLLKVERRSGFAPLLGAVVPEQLEIQDEAFWPAEHIRSLAV